MRCVLATLTSAVFALAGTVFFSAQAAFTQDYYQPGLRPGQGNEIQSSFTSRVPIDRSKDESEQQMEAVRSFYKIAARSCQEAVAAIADSCAISRLTITTRLEDSGVRGPTLSVTGQVTMRVTFKGEAEKAPGTAE